MQEENQHLKRELGLLDGTMLVVGSMIGSGIFIVSADIARQVGSTAWLLIIWLLSGIITIIAAGELWRIERDVPESRWSVCLSERSL